ncbi:MAG: inositol monophosphatase family protein [Pseudomonadota bacterium]|nr:inositol monophosphatase family protein [Pseudomonadota bacterium]
MAPDVDVYVDFACELANIAGGVIRPWFRQPIPVDTKADRSPVTVADRGVETALRGAIQDRFPDHGIIGEEFGATNGGAEWVWHLDPIDGTKSFITGSPLFATLIALTRNGIPVLGVIDQPILRERWVGVDGRPSTMNGRMIRTRACAGVDSAVFYSWGPECYDGENGDNMRRLAERTALRRYSADAYAFGLLALGLVDICCEDGLKPHDYLALAPVVNGAGGRITDWQGNAIRYGVGAQTIATGDPALHDKALELLAGA